MNRKNKSKLLVVLAKKKKLLVDFIQPYKSEYKTSCRRTKSVWTIWSYLLSLSLSPKSSSSSHYTTLQSHKKSTKKKKNRFFIYIRLLRKKNMDKVFNFFIKSQIYCSSIFKIYTLLAEALVSHVRQLKD